MIENRVRTSSPLLPNSTSLEILVNTIRQVNKIKGVQIEKKETKLSLYSGDIIVHTENHKESTKILWEMISNYTQVFGCDFNI